MTRLTTVKAQIPSLLTISMMKLPTKAIRKVPKNKSLIVVNSPKKPVGSKPLTAGKIVAGFEEETQLIISKLTSVAKDLDVISIIGIPGSDKTTLAYKVYNDESVSRRFNIHAWCPVGQEYDKRNLLEKVYNQVTGPDSKLNDLWDTHAWDKLTRPFPLVENGSRIILTSRDMEVGLYGKRSTDPLNLRLLRPEESWELLEKRAFGNDCCPDELLEVGKEIAENCKGLPLVSDLIAGVIAGREKKKSEWLVVRNNLNSFSLNSEVDVMKVIDLEVMKVIELSYEHLPHHLKPCLLYLARFPKDTTVETDELKMYWHTEGDDECGRSDGARKEKLFEWISSSDRCLQHCWISSSDLMPHIVNIVHDTENLELNNFVLFSSKKKHLYSLLITGDEMDDQLYDVYHLRDLRLLRVLQLFLSFIMVKDSLLNEICMLNHLRCLFFGTEVKSLPSSFSNLGNLEILHVNNKGSTFVLLPRIWDLVKLRELSVTACSFFDKDTDEPILIAEDSKLENLRALEQLVLSDSKDTEDIFKRFPNLQVLKFSLKESWDCSTQKYWFPKVDFLSELEFLNIPPSFRDICSLKIIQLSECPQLDDSSLKIKQYAEDMTGGDELKKGRHEKLLWKVQSWEEGIMEKREEEENNSSRPQYTLTSNIFLSPNHPPRMADTPQVVNAENNVIPLVVQFNPASQLPIKLLGSHNFATWKAQFSMLMHAATSAKIARDALHITYANKSQTRIFSLRDRLMRLTKESQPVTKYLQTTGAPVSNSELIVKILSGLGPEFHEISTAIRARDFTITYEELYEKLLDYELFLRHEESKKGPNQINVAAATSATTSNMPALISSGVFGYEILFDGMTPLLDVISFTKAVSALIALITLSCFALQS
ncbi:putative aldehyde dehydrogenase family 2 member B4, mitochondrial-like isoform X1 [Capsicum annuum]|nr:putative aldehyde dehydrogenase family 2 member B4, mitochondrial-like isoform X1 [Capsicum annuum]